MKRTSLKRKTPLKSGGAILSKKRWTKNRRFHGKYGDRRTSLQYTWKYWQFKCWGLFLSQKNKTENISLSCMHPNCDKRVDLVADHIIPRSNFRGDNWNPCNGAILCWFHNSEKGSQHGPKWDFRSGEYKEFQKKLRDKEWIHDSFKGWIPRQKESPS